MAKKQATIKITYMNLSNRLTGEPMFTDEEPPNARVDHVTVDCYLQPSRHQASYRHLYGAFPTLELAIAAVENDLTYFNMKNIMIDVDVFAPSKASES